MTNPNDPASPTHAGNPSFQIKGLTKRELFAAMAMQGLCAGKYEQFAGNSDAPVPISVACDSLWYADALIAELNRTEEEGK